LDQIEAFVSDDKILNPIEMLSSIPEVALNENGEWERRQELRTYKVSSSVISKTRMGKIVNFVGIKVESVGEEVVRS